MLKAFFVIWSVLFLPSLTLAQTVTVYSYRDPLEVRPLFDVFERQTGITVQLVFIKEGVKDRLLQEAENTPADLVFTVDIHRFQELKTAGLTAAVMQPDWISTIPAHLRDPEGHWFGLTLRSRAIYVSRSRVPKGSIKSYDDLLSPQWKGKVCLRTLTHMYNVSHLASIIARHGQQFARSWMTDLVTNLGPQASGGDRDQVRRIAEGACDVAIGNSYYLGKMLYHPEQTNWTSAVDMILPEQSMINISGMALTKNSPNPEGAKRLMAFLASPVAQQIYAEQNFEWPATLDVSPPGLVRSWGKLPADKQPLATVGNFLQAARDILLSLE
jgi:iron(III) transport system substrate-binding protein